MAAIHLPETERPDCVFLDLARPGMSGFVVRDRRQRDARTRQIPVLIPTATGYDVRNVERGRAGGAVEYLVKPLDTREVVERVPTAIERRQLQR